MLRVAWRGGWRRALSAREVWTPGGAWPEHSDGACLPQPRRLRRSTATGWRTPSFEMSDRIALGERAARMAPPSPWAR